jgi:hypothetical protein
MPSLEKSRLRHVKQDDSDSCIPASLSMALYYLDPIAGACFPQRRLVDLRQGRPPDFEVYHERLERACQQDPTLKHIAISAERAAAVPCDHAERQRQIKSAITDDSPVLLSLPTALPGWCILAVPRPEINASELIRFPLGGFHIRMCVACDDAGVWMLDPALDETQARVFVRWQTIEAAVTHPRGDGDVVGGGDILIVRGKPTPQASDGKSGEALSA